VNINIPALIQAGLAGFFGVEVILARLSFFHLSGSSDEISFGRGLMSSNFRHIRRIKKSGDGPE
jgi:hypothetical protein